MLQEEQIIYLCEILKVLFNLTLTLSRNYADGEDEVDFVKLVKTLSCLLLKKIENGVIKSKLHSHVADVLINVPEQHLKYLYTKIEQNDSVPEDRKFEENNLSVVYVLIQFLEKTLPTQTVSILNEHRSHLYLLNCSYCSF